MIIGIDASRANAQERTGTEWYSFHVIQGLKKRIPTEHTVVLYTKEPLREDLADLPDNWQTRVLGWKPGFLWTQLRLSWEMLWNRPDILYIPAHTIPLIHPKKVALVVHDVGFERQEELYDDAQIGYDNSFAKQVMNAAVRIATLGKYGATEMDYHRFSMNVALKAATSLITISEFSKAEIIDVYGFEGDRVHVIYNGLNDYSAVEADTTVFNTHNIGSDEQYVLFLGRIEQKKNVPTLINAFATLQSEYGFTGKLVLAGSPGYRYEDVQKAIAEHGIADQVVETGWISNEELSALMKRATVFILPSQYEGFGIPVLEAMQQGIPVVCSDIPPLREIADGYALFADPNSSQDIAKALHTFIASPEMRSEYSTKGAAHVATFNWESTAQGTWQRIEETLNS